MLIDVEIKFLEMFLISGLTIVTGSIGRDNLMRLKIITISAESDITNLILYHGINPPPRNPPDSLIGKHLCPICEPLHWTNCTSFIAVNWGHFVAVSQTSVV
jgi:hypothetical protein